MALPARTLLGPYEILGVIGAGGMGEVYRARDTRLGREVALKILPPEVANDPSRSQRFELEARAVAALNHPNIVAVYDVGSESGVFFIVSELVDGEPLRARKFGLRKTLDFGVQIASGLAAAHNAGITHRDLKPDNILVTRDGRIKILDFGLAKVSAAKAAAAATETMTIRTEPGVVMGTVGYMAPEQVRGKEVDDRSDIFSLGVILYELLSGRRAFQCETAVDTMMAVLSQELPDLPDAVPPGVRQIVQHCLEKEPVNRFQSARDLSFALAATSESASQSGPAAALPVIPRWRRWMMLALAVLATSIVFAAYLWRTVSAPAGSAWKGTFLGGPSQAIGPRISPDGKILAFQAMVDGLFQVAVMKPESGNWALLSRGREDGPVQEITWSPDGTRLYFSRVLGSRRGIYSIPVLGGEERLVLDGASTPEMLPDGSLLVLKIDAKRKMQIHHFWPETGKLEPLPAEVDFSDVSPPMRTFPDGKEAAYVGWPLAGEQTVVGTLYALYALDLATGKSRQLAPKLIPPKADEIGFPMAISPDGRKVLLRLSAGDMRAVVAFPRNGNGAPETWLDLTQNLWYLDAGPDGSLYMDQVQERPEALRFSSGGGRPERLLDGIVLGPVLQRNDESLLVSRVFAGHVRVAIERPGGDMAPVSETREETGIWITNLGERAVAFPLGSQGKMAIAIASLPDGRIIRRLPVSGGVIGMLASSPDGQRIFYVSGQKAWSVSAEGGEPTNIGAADSVTVGSEEIVLELNANDGFDLLRAPLAGGNPVRVGLSSSAKLTGVALHPAAVGPSGRVLVQVNEPHMWFYRMAAVDLKTGRLNRIPVDYDGDIWYPGWTPDGKIIATGVKYGFSLWQMRH